MIFLQGFEAARPLEVGDGSSAGQAAKRHGIVFLKTLFWEFKVLLLFFKNNFQVSKWFPQQDLLGHPRVRLFIGHGGQSGFQEALCHQKPMVNY